MFKAPTLKNMIIVSPKVYDRLAKELGVAEKVEHPLFIDALRLEPSIWVQENYGYAFDKNGKMKTIIFEDE